MYVRHYPTTRHTQVADTPENRRLAQQTKQQSEVGMSFSLCTYTCIHVAVAVLQHIWLLYCMHVSVHVQIVLIELSLPASPSFNTRGIPASF